MSDVKMPEPMYAQGDYPSRGEIAFDCYSSDQMEDYAEAYAAEKVREALEAAYAIAFRENFGGKRAGDRSWAECAGGIAERIRDLIRKQ